MAATFLFFVESFQSIQMLLDINDIVSKALCKEHFATIDSQKILIH